MILERIENLLGTPLANLMFSTQARLEAKPLGIDWRLGFCEVAETVFETMGVRPLSSQTREEASRRFVECLCACPMDDLLYADVPEALNSLCAAAGEIVLWSQGDVVNGHQARKIEASGVRGLLRRACEEHHAAFVECIVPKKTESIREVLQSRFELSERPNRMWCTVYDDAPENLLAFHEAAQAWSASVQVVCDVVLIRAVCGRRAHEPSPETGEVHLHKARTLTEAVALMRHEGAEGDMDVGASVVFLDFDGALADNNEMRHRQATIMYQSVRELLREGVLQEKFDEHFWYT